MTICNVCKEEFQPSAAHILTCPSCLKKGFFEEHTKQYIEEQKQLLCSTSPEGILEEVAAFENLYPKPKETTTSFENLNEEQKNKITEQLAVYGVVYLEKIDRPGNLLDGCIRVLDTNNVQVIYSKEFLENKPIPKNYLINPKTIREMAEDWEKIAAKLRNDPHYLPFVAEIRDHYLSICPESRISNNNKCNECVKIEGIRTFERFGVFISLEKLNEIDLWFVFMNKPYKLIKSTGTHCLLKFFKDPGVAERYYESLITPYIEEEE